jgi:hypothetical protein
MKKFAILGLIIALLGTHVFAQAPEPQTEHAWLKQLVGEWEYDTEACLEAGKPPVKITGTEQVRMVGGFWAISEYSAKLSDSPFTGILTLGFDGEKKKYVGTWIDSMNSYLLHYEGTVDTAGKSLTLLTEGPDPAAPGKRCKFKEVIEVKDRDHKVVTTSMQGDDGKWVPLMTINYRRMK